jgi:hypothetical protein
MGVPDPRANRIMRTRLAVVLSVLVAQTVLDALPVLASAGCVKGAAARAACCCGPASCETQPAGTGLAAACCDMRAPVRDQVPASLAREQVPATAAPSPVLNGGLVPDVAPPPASAALAQAPRWEDPAPPLYDLFRAYRN